MATLDSLLADIFELSDNETEIENDAQKEEEDKIIVNTLNYDDLSKLQKTQRFSDIMQKVEEVLDSEYKLIVDCSKLLVEIEKEIAMIHNFIRHNYKLKFRELELLVHDAIDYARVVKRIGNEMNLALVDLKDLLPSGMAIALVLIAPRTSGQPLQKDVLERTIEACDRAIDLDSSQKKVIDSVEIKMRSIAPNLSAIVGSKVAAKIMVSAGGLSELANLPPTKLVAGQKRKKSFVGPLVDCLEKTEIVLNTPPEFRSDACELLAAKLALAASVDLARGDSSGTKGKAFREEILEEIKKRQQLKRMPQERTEDSSEDDDLLGLPQSLEPGNMIEYGRSVPCYYLPHII